MRTDGAEGYFWCGSAYDDARCAGEARAVLTETGDAVGSIGSGNIVDIEGTVDHGSPAVVGESATAQCTTTDVGGS